MTVFASDGTIVTDPAPEPTPIDVVENPEPAPEPEVVETTTESDAVVVDAEVVTDLAVVDTDEPAEVKWVHSPEWGYDWFEYKGDFLAIRVPQQNALTALYQATASCSEEFQMKLTNKFVKSHLSQESIERVLERMSDPDDTEFASEDGGWSDLLKSIAELGGKRALKDAEALAAVQNGNGK